MINLSPAATQEIKRLQVTRQKNNSLFRIAVKEGGCSGLLYSLGFEDQAKPDDYHYESQSIAIIVDPHSEQYLQELTLDYSEDLMGGGFRFHNPQASQSCGCGHSFSISLKSDPDFSRIEGH